MGRLLLGLLVSVLLTGRALAGDITVLAAASLTDALNAIGDAYHTKSGNTVKFSFAGSSTLAKQIEAGAPADVFASASEDWMKYLADRKLIDPASRFSPIGNTLVMIAPASLDRAPFTISSKLDLVALLGTGGRLAVADPAHVPAGVYAKQALTHYGLWDGVQSHLAVADDVRGALAFVARGETPLGIVYKTDALISKSVKAVATFSEDSHDKITYPFALVKGAHPEAAGFLAYLKTNAAKAVFDKYGFSRN